MAQIVDGWAEMERDIRAYFRTTKNFGLLTPETIAAALTEGESMVHDIVLESRINWAIKTVEIDDEEIGTSIFGNTRRFLIEDDLGILDFARAKDLWRLPESADGDPAQFGYVESESAEDHHAEGRFLSGTNAERYNETGAVNADGEHQLAIQVFNWRTGGNALGDLRIEYFYTPAAVNPDWFTEADSSGNLLRKPALPRQVWPHIKNYAKFVLCEVTGDIDKHRFLRNRLNGRTGTLNRLREFLSNFQSGAAVYVVDTIEL